ncbi:Rieske (2Fe-2S) protein [Nakamurella lactea]|uniref:Rieske (2Fe-2S) protein n=1 Tax=Nakamurella lactea TaxID=459515 RepID=UPI0004122D13|nr:Rieske (2Fe-2S) protein [Nakamurella lactea]
MPELLTRRSALTGTATAVLAVGAGYAATRWARWGVPNTLPDSHYRPDPAVAEPLARIDDVPVGGGLVLEPAGVVLTRPSPGEVHAFSAICTHQGCTVTDVAAGTIRCPCHGSRFDAVTGAVTQGPATVALPAVQVMVSGGVIRRSTEDHR